MKKILMSVVLIGSLGCMPGVKVAQIGAAPAGRPAKSAKVDVYYKAADVEKRFRPIAELTADDKGWDYNYSFLEDMIVKRARKLGAHAVIFHDPEEETGAGGYTMRGVLVVPKVNKTVMKATAIVYLP